MRGCINFLEALDNNNLFVVPNGMAEN